MHHLHDINNIFDNICSSDVLVAAGTDRERRGPSQAPGSSSLLDDDLIGLVLLNITINNIKISLKNFL